MQLSVVTTLYHSAPYLQEFYRRITGQILTITEDYELIFVNDGSPDDSLEIALSLYESDPKIKVIDLSRNFGHHKAIMTGLAHAQGQHVFLIDCDLEEQPELLGEFHAAFQNANADVVYGVQDKRKGGWFEKISGAVFYKVVNFLSHQPVPANVLVTRLMTRRYVVSLVQHRDREFFLLGLWTITGYKQVPLVVTKRSKGTSTYTLVRKIAILVNAVTSFTHLPLLFIFYLGLGIMALASCAALILIIQRLFFHVYLAGWPSLIVSIWLLGGMTIFCLGILGVYLAKIFSETKERPYTVIRHIYQRQQ